MIFNALNKYLHNIYFFSCIHEHIKLHKFATVLATKLISREIEHEQTYISLIKYQNEYSTLNI